MRPKTLTVSLTLSGTTMSFSPFGSVETAGCTGKDGTLRRASALEAHSGRATGFTLEGAKDSCPPNDFCEMGFPEGVGVRIATIAWDGCRYVRATRFTSARVTFWIAATSSSGEFLPSMATALDHTNASPEIELLWNAASASSCALAACTKSGGSPFLTSAARIC